MNPTAAAGVMGNIMQESSLNPNAQNPNGATGLAQWMGGRLTALKNFAASQGKSWNDPMVQTQYLLSELQSGGNGSISGLNSAGSAAAAAAYFESNFERSGGDSVANRENYANQYLARYGGGR